MTGLTAAGAGGQKIALCHTTGNGHYAVIDVSLSAESAHRAHGDAAPGEAIPSQAGTVFGGDCTPVVSAPVQGLMCGAPPNAVNPGSTSSPGPALDVTGGAQSVQYKVTAVPAPPYGTLMDVAVYLNGTSLAVYPVPLANGEYTQLNHQVNMSSMSAVYEIRFTMSSSQCSLYWNLNP